MKLHHKNISGFVLILVFILLIFPSSGLAGNYVIVLKDGRKIKADVYGFEGSKIRVHQNDSSYVIDRNKVAEIIKLNAKTILDVQDFVKATMSESTERSKTRRSIAVLWIKTHLAIILFFCIATPWNQEVASQYLALATSGTMGGITGAISIFFFGSQGLARHNESKK